MPFDPDKPANNSPLSSQEMRDQLNALNDATDSLSTQVNGTALHPAGVAELFFSITDPPTASDLQILYDKFNELLGALKRT